MKRTKLIPSILAMGFIPLIVHIHEYDNGLSQFIWYPEDSFTSDFFLFWKMVAIIIVGVIMLGILFHQRYIKREQLKFEKSFYFAFIYIVFVLLSALFSPYNRWVVCGSTGRFESVLVLLSYMVFCYYTYNFVQEEAQVKSLLGWSSIGMLVVTLLAIFQFFGMDFFKTTLGKKLLLNPSQWNNLDGLNFSDTAYSTLCNINNLSFYFGIAVPLLACLIIGARKLSHRIVFILLEALAILALIAGQSLTGWIAVGMAVPIVVLIMLSRRKKFFVAGLSLVGIALVIGIIACITTPLGGKLSDTFLGSEKLSEAFSPQSVETKDDEVVMTIHENELHLSYDLNSENNSIAITCQDAEGKDLECRVSEDDPTTLIITDPAYLGCTVTPVAFDDALLSIEVYLDDRYWYFTKEIDGTYYYINPALKPEKYVSNSGIELFGCDAMTGRGQIWNHTIPLLKDYIFLGVGANCFVFAYPQSDYIFRTYANIPNTFDSRPHNWYLQQWIETGMIGFLALLIFYLWYAIRSIRIYRRANLHDSLSWVGIGIFSGTLAYMIAGLANDSNVCTAPVFWIILGLGMAVNRMIVEKEGLFGYIGESTDGQEETEFQP